MMNKTSENMKKMYSEKKKLTLKKIQDAINTIQEEGRIVTKKELMHLTGLSSGTFSQEHVKLLLEKNQVCQFKSIKIYSSQNKKEETQNQIIERLSKQNEKNNSIIQNLTIALEKKTDDCKKIKEENKKLNYDYQLLKGKYQQALEYLEVLGVDLTKFNIC